MFNEENLALVQWYREQLKAYDQAMSTYDQEFAARAATAILYCNTIGRWYRPLSATDAGKGWSSAHQQNLSDQPGEERCVAESPFHSFTKSGTAYCGDFDWTTLYMGTEEAKQLAARLLGAAKLERELTDVGFITARYLITSDRFEAGSEGDTWKMDAFEVANVVNAEGTGFMADKAHFSGRYPAYTNRQTPLRDMFVLQVAARDKQKTGREGSMPATGPHDRAGWSHGGRGADIPSDVRVLVRTGGADSWRTDGVDADAVQRFEVRDGMLELLETPTRMSSRVPMNPGSYECWFEFTDVYGGVTISAKATCTIE